MIISQNLASIFFKYSSSIILVSKIWKFNMLCKKKFFIVPNKRRTKWKKKWANLIKLHSVTSYIVIQRLAIFSMRGQTYNIMFMMLKNKFQIRKFLDFIIIHQKALSTSTRKLVFVFDKVSYSESNKICPINETMVVRCQCSIMLKLCSSLFLFA